jgi:CRP-like cAMP-binding protein
MAPIGERDPRRNRLLQALKPDEYARLERHLQIVAFTVRQPLYEANDPITTVYFPLTGVLALVNLLEGGETLAIACIGNEGFVGHALALGADRMPYHVVCKVASTCAAMRADTFREQIRVDSRFHMLLLRNTQALFNQVALIASCNRVHPVEKRLATCFLILHDRTGIDEFPMTHEFLAELLGVRRATITEAAASLQHAGVIRNERGRIIIANRAGLEAAACECYRAMRDQYEEVLQLAA